MTAADARGRRLDAATGILFVVVALVAFFLPGTPPKADDTTQKITTFIVDHRSSILAGDFLFGVASFFFVWFLGTLRSYLRAAEGGEGRLSAASFGGGLVAIALILVGTAVINGIAFKIARDGGDPTVIRGLFDTSNAAFAFSGFGFAAFFGAASCSAARSGVLPGWIVWSGALAALVQAVSAVALFAESGFFAVGGAFGFITVLLSVAWVLAVSVLLIRRFGAQPAASSAP